MTWYIVVMMIAAVLYTWAVWGAYAEQELCPLFVGLFIGGVVCDLIGTAPMIALATGFDWRPHTILGVSALMIMVLHGAWACLSFRWPKTDQMFHRWSPWAYTLWMAAFVTGGTLHFLGR